VSTSLRYRSKDERLEVRGNALILGMTLFLGSELMFFASLFAAYFDLRGHAAVWPPPYVHLNVTDPWIETGLMASSAVLVYLCVRQIRAGTSRNARLFLGAAILCGCVFLWLTVKDWLGNDFTISSSAYGSIFYTLTGVEALHLLAGLLALGYVFVGAGRSAFVGANAAGAEAIAYFWYFVFGIWALAVFPIIYYVR
jgi:cytochrome c oxidase subunit 3